MQLPLSILNTELKSWFKCMPHAQMQIWPSQKLSAVTYVVLPVVYSSCEAVIMNTQFIDINIFHGSASHHGSLHLQWPSAVGFVK